MIAVVLGMHKSGTTLVAEILHRAGIAMVEAVPEDSDYDHRFYFERAEVVAINKELLGGDAYSLDTALLQPQLRDEALRQRIANLVAALESAGTDWGFKDPRTCLTWPLWRELLPPHRLVCVYRHPLAVERHYRLRNRQSSFRALRAWSAYNARVLEAHCGARPGTSVLISYDALMADAGELARLGEFLGRPLPDLRRPEKQRHPARPGGSARIADLALPLAGWPRATALHRKLEAVRRAEIATRSSACAASEAP